MYIRKKIENETEQLWFRIKKIIKKKMIKTFQKEERTGKGALQSKKIE